MHRCAPYIINSLRPRQNGRHFADDNFKGIFVNENIRISIKISLKLVPKGPINNNPALVQIMAWRWPGNKPLSEPMMTKLPMHICVTRPPWINSLTPENSGFNFNKANQRDLIAGTGLVILPSSAPNALLPWNLTDGLAKIRSLFHDPRS